MASITPFLEAVAHRRSIYALTKESPIPNSRIQEIVHEALKHAPSPFNVRSARAIILFGDDHSNLWREAYTITEKDSPQAICILGPKIKGLECGKGTVLFFDDQTAYDSLTPRFRALSKQYTEWEEHSSGMHQFIVWTALEAEGLGCNLPHFQPSITPYISATYQVPELWKLKCQLVFGGLKEGVPRPGAKEKTHLESALNVYGA
jgi:predicted oxidoreductase (fatty acid repression mutant protein)